MKSLIHRIFIEHWTRKLISVILAIIIWLVVDHTLTSTRNISNVAVRVIHLPPGKTIEGMQPGGRLSKKLTLTVVGNKTLIDELSSSDIEVVVDASDRPDEWIVNITKKNLVSLNPEIDISGISRVYHPSFVIRMTKLVTDRIPIIITQPIGEPPRGYQFLDVWPYRLFLTVKGPEEVVKKLKLKEQKLTFNLSDITKKQLDESALQSENTSEVVSYFVPEQWKQMNIPLLSDAPIEIDDPQAKALRIDFVRCNLLPINTPIQFGLFFPEDHLQLVNPSTINFAPSSLVHLNQGIAFVTGGLFANGVDRLFLDIVKEMIQIVIIAAPSLDNKPLDWSVLFVNPRQLEDRYVAKLMPDVSDRDIHLLQPTLREEYLRNRFRSYMNHFQLFRSSDTPFDPIISLKEGLIHIEEPSL